MLEIIGWIGVLIVLVIPIAAMIAAAILILTKED
jgi:hypothetical protein